MTLMFGYWTESNRDPPTPQIDVLAEPVNVTLFGNRVFGDVIR